MNKHTPGPWIAEQRDTRSVVLAAKGRCLLADCPQWSNRDDRPRAAEAFANAKLFAAAPDLLEALEAFERISALWLPAEVEEQHAEEMYALHMARNQMLAAIAKARGEA